MGNMPRYLGNHLREIIYSTATLAAGDLTHHLNVIGDHKGRR